MAGELPTNQCGPKYLGGMMKKNIKVLIGSVVGFYLLIVILGSINLYKDMDDFYCLRYKSVEKFKRDHKVLTIIPFSKGIVRSFERKSLLYRFNSFCEGSYFFDARSTFRELLAKNYLNQEKLEKLDDKLNLAHPLEVWRVKKGKILYFYQRLLDQMKKIGEKNQEMENGIKDIAIAYISDLKDSKYTDCQDVHSEIIFLCEYDLKLSLKDKEVIKETFYFFTNRDYAYDIRLFREDEGVTLWDQSIREELKINFKKLEIDLKILETMRKNVNENLLNL
jgi:hypothetical protein